MTSRSVLAAATIAGLLGAACASGSSTTTATPQATSDSAVATTVLPPDKAGTPATKVTTIKVGNVNEASASEGPTLQEFAKQVNTLSKGTMRVSFDWDLDGTANGLTHPTSEAVRKGDVAMAAEWAGAWGTQGVTTLQALQAPFVIRSFAQAEAVLDDTTLMSDMLGGLKSAGVVGLTIFPVDIRPIVDFAHPVVTPADLNGQVFRSPWSNETWPLLKSLGADPQNYPSEPGARDFSPGNQSSMPKGWVVGNLPLGFRFYTLVANEAFWTSLTADQQQILRAAAVATRDFAVAAQTENKALANMVKYCNRGGTIQQLDATGLDAFVKAAAPTVQALATDSFTASALEKITALGKGATATVFPTCSHDPGATTDAAPIPNGVYRIQITDDDLRRAETDPANWAADRGVYTITLKDGKFSYTQQADGSNSSDLIGGGTYVVDHNFVTFTEPAGPNNEPNPTVMTWEVAADRSLSFKIVTSNFNYVRFFYGEPWIRIADAP